MNQLTPFLSYILSAVIPVAASVLNDPAPQRKWLRILVVAGLTLAAAYVQMLQSGAPITITLYAQAVAQLATGSQVVHRLFGHVLGKLETLTGPGLGALVDGLLRASASGVGGGTEDALGQFRATQARLDAFLVARAITKEQYDAAFSLAQQELIAGVATTGERQ